MAELPGTDASPGHQPPGQTHNSQTTDTRGPARPWAATWLRFGAGLLVVAACFYFLGSRLLRDWHKVPWQELRLNVPLLLTAMATMLGWMVLYGFTWKVLLGTLGESISLFNSISVLAVSQVGKYVPGKLWFTVGRMYLAKKHRVSEAKTAVSTVMEIALSLLAAIMLFGIAVALVPRSLVPSRAYYAFALIPICILAVYPPLLSRLTNFVLRRLRQPAVEIKVSFAQTAGVLGLYLLMWVVQGCGCYMLVSSFYPLAVTKLPMVAGAFALSWILGFVVLVSPAGLGVREGVFTFALKMVVPEPVAIIAALFSRLWITAAEGLLAVVFALLPKPSKLRSQ